MKTKSKEVFTIPSGIHETDVTIPIQSVWTFVSHIDQWAPLVPGYIGHKMINEHQSTWSFIGDVGVVQKTIHLQVNIKEWDEPTKITFDLIGLNENICGYGYFKAAKIYNTQTKITGYIHVTAKGIMGPVVNPILKSFIPRMTKQLTQAVANKVNEPVSITVTS